MSKSETPKKKAKTPKNLKSALSGDKSSERLKDLLKIDDNSEFDLYEVMTKNRFFFEMLARNLAKASIGFDDWSDVIDSSPEHVHDFIYGKKANTGKTNESEPDNSDFDKFSHENEVKSNFMEKMEPYYSIGDYSSYRYFDDCYKAAIKAGFKGTPKAFENYIKTDESFKDFAQEALTRNTN